MESHANNNHNPHERRHIPRHPEWRPLPSEEAMQADMMAVARAMLGPQLDEQSRARWEVVEDAASYSGQAVRDGRGNYFIYGKSTILPHGSKQDYWGLKRVRFHTEEGKEQIKKTISTQAYRQPSDEFPPDRPDYQANPPLLLEQSEQPPAQE